MSYDAETVSCGKVEEDSPPSETICMIDAILAKVFGAKNERGIKALLPAMAAADQDRTG
jgi:hypothetical protein